MQGGREVAGRGKTNDNKKNKKLLINAEGDGAKFEDKHEKKISLSRAVPGNTIVNV